MDNKEREELLKFKSEVMCYCRKDDQISCGNCDICGKKGHICHSPTAPATGGYCRYHYFEEAGKK